MKKFLWAWLNIWAIVGLFLAVALLLAVVTVPTPWLMHIGWWPVGVLWCLLSGTAFIAGAHALMEVL